MELIEDTFGDIVQTSRCFGGLSPEHCHCCFAVFFRGKEVVFARNDPNLRTLSTNAIVVRFSGKFIFRATTSTIEYAMRVSIETLVDRQIIGTPMDQHAGQVGVLIGSILETLSNGFDVRPPAFVLHFQLPHFSGPIL